MSIPMRREMPAIGTVEDVLIRGNLADLKPEQRTEYYMRMCQSIGLNPLTRPFEYLTLNGKLVLYARRDCADQLRKINGISVEIVSQDRAGDLLSVHVRAKDKDGRTDEDLGVVYMPQTLKGDAAANAILKAVTKAKRRVTLSISGLGFLDETEIEDVPIKPSNGTRIAAPSGPITDEQANEIAQLIADTQSDIDRFLKWVGAESLSDIPASKFANCIAMLKSKQQKAANV